MKIKRFTYILSCMIVSGSLYAADLYYAKVTVYHAFWSQGVQIKVITEGGIPTKVLWTNGRNQVLHDVENEGGIFWGHNSKCEMVSIVLGNKIATIRNRH